MHMFEEKYPTISELYYDFINSGEYTHSALTQYNDRHSTELFRHAAELIQSGDQNGATDKMMFACTEYEHAAFIFGFVRALHILKESGTVEL